MDAGNEFPSLHRKEMGSTLSLTLYVSLFFLPFLCAKVEALLAILFRLSVVAIFTLTLALLLAQFGRKLLGRMGDLQRIRMAEGKRNIHEYGAQVEINTTRCEKHRNGTSQMCVARDAALHSFS